jgi:hypothetical protein
MNFELRSTPNEGGQSAGGLSGPDSLGISFGGLPQLQGDPRQSERDAHILKHAKLGMQSLLDDGLEPHNSTEMNGTISASFRTSGEAHVTVGGLKPLPGAAAGATPIAHILPQARKALQLAIDSATT